MSAERAAVVHVEPGIVVRDVDRQLRFYTEAMGFELVLRIDFDAVGSVLRLRRGDARMKLFAPAGTDLDPAPGDDRWVQPGGFRYAALLVDSRDAVDELAAACVAGGGRMLAEPFEHRPGARVSLITDPEGNPWELLYG